MLNPAASYRSRLEHDRKFPLSGALSSRAQWSGNWYVPGPTCRPVCVPTASENQARQRMVAPREVKAREEREAVRRCLFSLV